jgi:hypothetical protein
MRYVRTCVFCHVPQGFEMGPETEAAYASWRAGHGYVQNIPGLTVDRRELLLSGVCEKCFPKEPVGSGKSSCPLCPACGAPASHLVGTDEEGATDCGGCGKRFRYTPWVEVTYTTTRIPAD